MMNVTILARTPLMNSDAAEVCHDPQETIGVFVFHPHPA